MNGCVSFYVMCYWVEGLGYATRADTKMPRYYSTHRSRQASDFAYAKVKRKGIYTLRGNVPNIV